MSSSELDLDMCSKCKCNDCNIELKYNVNGQQVSRKCSINCDNCKLEQIICVECFVKNGV